MSGCLAAPGDSLNHEQVITTLNNFIEARNLVSLGLTELTQNLKFHFDNRILQVCLPHRLYGGYFLKKNQKDLEKLVRACFGEDICIHYTLPESQAKFPLRVGDNIADPFSDYIVSPKNQAAVTAARDVTAANTPVLLIFAGPAGSGKSHLLSAIQSAVQTSGRRCLVCRPCTFKPIEPPDDFWSVPRALLIDDLHDMLPDRSAQHLLARHIDHAGESGHWARIVLTVPTPHFQSFLPELTAKLETGLLVETCRADLAMRLQFAEIQCANMGLPRQMALPLARHAPHISAIKGLLQKLALYGKITGRFPAVTEIEKLAISSEKLPGWQMVINQVGRKLQLKPADLLGESRIKALARGRQIAMYICRHKLGLSYPEIGRLFGGRDHSTVMHGINKIQLLRRTDSDLHNLLTELEREAPPELQ